MEDSMKVIEAVINNVEKVIIGKRQSIKLIVIGLLTNGHILIEDIPGVGKTVLTLALAKSISGDFKRIQFTPDLLPSDVTGGSVYNQKKGEFEFKPGPIFTHILLADEINRTNPRTQSSLLECMQENKVTADGQTFQLPQPFIVIATQNPIEFQGTYPLPEAQIDRFLMKISMGYLTREEEIHMMRIQQTIHPVETLQAVTDVETIVQLQKQVKNIEISEKIMRYIVDIVAMTRSIDTVKIGASPRASISFMHASRAWALIEGRNYVVPNDIHNLAHWVLGHRIILHPRAVAVGMTSRQCVEEVLSKVSVV